MFPVFPDQVIRNDDEGNEEDEGAYNTPHNDRVVEPLDPPERRIIESGPEPPEGFHGQECESDTVEERIQEIGNPCEESSAEEECGEIDTEEEHDEKHNQRMDTEQWGESWYEGKSKGKADLGRIGFGVQQLQKVYQHLDHRVPLLPWFFLKAL